MKEENLFDVVNFNSQGLVAAVAQDYKNKDVLMMAFMNKESITKTIETGLVHYFSRSRNRLWKKGESSGQLQRLEEFLVDCDGDSILLKVTQLGNPIAVACHTGRKNCFFRKLEKNGKLSIKQEILINSENLYDKK